MRIVIGDTEIRTLEEWRQAMPPRLRNRQWREGRSAMELARAWVGKGAVAVPEEVWQILESSRDFAGAELLDGRPEEETRLDDFRGNSRNADLLLTGRLQGEPVVIAVEAKADESFGPTIGEYLAEKEQVERSNAPARMRQLSAAVFGTEPEEIGDLRYQLLHAVAATLIAAAERRAQKALFLVHEFPAAGDPVRLERNAADLAAFVRRLGGDADGPSGRIVGPFEVPGGGRVPDDVQLFVGKAERKDVLAWQPRTLEDRLLERYLDEHPGELFLELEVGGRDANRGARRIDGVLVPGRPSGVRRPGSYQTSEAHDAIHGEAVHLLEAKRTLNRNVVGQVLAGAALLERDFGPSSIEGVAVCASGYEDLEWYCENNGIHVALYPEIGRGSAPRRDRSSSGRRDVRNPPDSVRRGRFMKGWDDAVAGRLYRSVGSRKTHANMGNLFGWIYGEQSEEFREETWRRYVSSLDRADSTSQE